MEEVKWTDIKNNMPLYDVTFPYIRMMAGPVDYTPGAMRNATKADWRAMYSTPASMGTGVINWLPILCTILLSRCCVMRLPIT